MTIDQLNKLTDEEVRVRVAERMGWIYPGSTSLKLESWGYWIPPKGGKTLRFRVPNYPADLNAAFTLVEKLKADKWDAAIIKWDDEHDWSVELFRGEDNEYADDPNLARAISIAFLAVTEREEE